MHLLVRDRLTPCYFHTKVLQLVLQHFKTIKLYIFVLFLTIFLSVVPTRSSIFNLPNQLARPHCRPSNHLYPTLLSPPSTFNESFGPLRCFCRADCLTTLPHFLIGSATAPNSACKHTCPLASLPGREGDSIHTHHSSSHPMLALTSASTLTSVHRNAHRSARTLTSLTGREQDQHPQASRRLQPLFFSCCVQLAVEESSQEHGKISDKRAS